MSQLDQQQIESLYKFTRQHFVEHYDLQTELVDHMAHGIEQQWEQHPKLTFEQARDREFKKFGVFGFMEVVEERQNALSKKYLGIVWKHFKDYMRLPKVIGFVAMVVGFYLLLKLSTVSGFIFMGAVIGSSILYLTVVSYRNIKLRKNRKTNDKRWMFEEMIFNQGSLGGVVMIPLYFFNSLNTISEIETLNSFWLLLMSLSICCFYLFIYIMLVEIPKHAEKYLAATYPEYKLV
jgi:hypothetical protein